MCALSSKPTDLNASAPNRSLVALTLGALAVRLLFLVFEPATHPVGDERTWTGWVMHLVSPRVSLSPLRNHMIFHPPLYPYFLALPYRLFGDLEAAKWAQAVVAALLVPAVGRVGCLAFGPRVGVTAAAVTAFYPELVWFSVHFWVESLFMVLLWWSLERLLASDARGRALPAVAAGFLWGSAILARETILYFLPLAALWLARRPRARGAPLRAALFLITACLTVAPWTYRNWRVFHAFVPVSTAGGLNLFQGNARLSRQEVYDLYEAVQGRIEQYHYARRMGLEAIGERQPGWFFEKLAEQMPMFWEAESMALIHIKRGAYDEAGPGIARCAAVVMLAPYLIVLVVFIPGVASLSLTASRSLLVLLLVYYNLIHVATHGFNRYRLPIMPVVFLFSSAALVAWRRGELHLGARRKLLAAALGLALTASLVPSLRRQIRHEAFGFGHQDETPAGESAPP